MTGQGVTRRQVFMGAGPFLRAYDQTPGNELTGLHGVITVSDPYGVQTDYGDSPQNVDLTVRQEKPGTVSQVGVAARQRIVQGGESIDLVFTRHGGDLSTPLAIAFTTAGTARDRYDYGGLGKVAVIPPGARETTINVQTYPRRQDSDPLQRSLVVAPTPGARYSCDRTPPAFVLINA